MAKASDNRFPYVHLVPAAAPSSPSAGAERVYLDSGDGNKLKRKNSSGTVTTIEGGGGGGGGLAASYVGKNAIGASWQTIATNGVFKKVTTTGASVLLGVQAYLRMQGDAPSGFGAALFTDNSGTPDRLLSHMSQTDDRTVLDASGSEIGSAGVGRWYGVPLTYLLAATTDYWIGLWSSDFAGQVDIAYDTSGSDRTYTGISWLADWGRYTVATTTRDHSIRGLILA